MTSKESVDESLIRLCRAGIGDTLRCVVHVAPERTRLLYLRRDLARVERARGRELERTRVVQHDREQSTGDSPTVVTGEVTVAAFDAGEHEVRVTSDDPHGGDCDFADLAPTVRSLLRLAAPPAPAGR